MNHHALFAGLLLAGAGAIAACQSVGDERTGSSDEAVRVAEQRAQDRAWGFRRDDAHENRYLTEHGAGSLTESNAYYTKNLRGAAADNYTLPKWKAQFIGSLPVYTSLYYNRTELGFWREMTCTQVIRRGSGGCMVTNWGTERDKIGGIPNKGTVAMTVSPEGFTQFYVFLPDDRLSPTAVLDSEGPKFAPRLCTVCHGGFAVDPGTNPDFGSIFREFQPSQLDGRSDISRGQAEIEWFNLNQAIRSANQAIRFESEGAPAGTDHAKAAMGAYVDLMYPESRPPARQLSDPAFVPVSWQGGSARVALWTDVVMPYCMSCHRHNLLDWSVYARFSFLKNRRDGVALLRSYTTVIDGQHPLPFMPQTELGFGALGGDAPAQTSMDGWIASCVPGSSCVPANPCHSGQTTCNGTEPLCVDTGSPLPDATSCGQRLVCQSGECVSDGSCNPTVLLLDDVATPENVEMNALLQALRDAGLVPTVIDNGASAYIGRPSASAFGAILVKAEPINADPDMDLDGQRAILAANAAGVGVVFDGLAAAKVAGNKFQELAPIVISTDVENMYGRGPFTLTSPNHPIWDGLPTSFRTVTNTSMTSGAPIHGGVAIASLEGSHSPPGAGVIVKDAPGRVVELAYVSNYDTPWGGGDPKLTLLMTNAVKWAARCL